MRLRAIKAYSNHRAPPAVNTHLTKESRQFDPIRKTLILARYCEILSLFYVPEWEKRNHNQREEEAALWLHHLHRQLPAGREPLWTLQEERETLHITVANVRHLQNLPAVCRRTPDDGRLSLQTWGRQSGPAQTGRLLRFDENTEDIHCTVHR